MSTVTPRLRPPATWELIAFAALRLAVSSVLGPPRQYNDGANSLYLCCGQEGKGSPHYKVTFCPEEGGGR